MMDLDALMRTLTHSFSNRLLEVSLISSELSLREVLYIGDITLRSGCILLKTDSRCQLSLEISRLSTVHLYGPASLVFIMNSGTTLTLRQESLL